MLRKITIALSSLLIATGSYAAAAPMEVASGNDNANFVGANVALGVGYNMLNIHNRHYLADGTVSHHDLGNNGFATQLSTGYNFGLGSSWILGPELHGQYNTTQAASSTDRGDATSDAHTTVHWIYGGDVKLGYAASQDNLLYVLAGPDWGTYKHEFNANSSASHKRDNTNQLGVLVGVGAEQAMNSNWHIREQFNYDKFNTDKVRLADGSTSKSQANSGTFLVSAVYQF